MSALQPVSGISISDPNYRAANAANFANWLNWIQCTTPTGATPPISAADLALAAGFGIDTSNVGNSGRPGANVAAANVPSPATPPVSTMSPISRGSFSVQPVWGGTPRLIPVSLPSPGGTSIQALGTPAASGFSFSSIPWWGWGIAAAAAYFMFAGGGHGR